MTTTGCPRRSASRSVRPSRSLRANSGAGRPMSGEMTSRGIVAQTRGEHDQQRGDQNQADEEDLAVHAAASAPGAASDLRPEKRRPAGSRQMAVPATMMKTPIQIHTTAGVTMARIPMLPSVPTFISER